MEQYTPLFFSEEHLPYSDQERDGKLQEKGITTFRFENTRVWNNLVGILDEIKNYFKNPRSFIPPPR